MTNSSVSLDDKIARVADILEQIENLNKVIHFHQTNDGNNSTINQYQYMKRKFIKELSGLLNLFQLVPHFEEV